MAEFRGEQILCASEINVLKFCYTVRYIFFRNTIVIIGCPKTYIYILIFVDENDMKCGQTSHFNVHGKVHHSNTLLQLAEIARK